MIELDWSPIPAALPLLGKGLWVTIQITLTAVLVGLVLGILLAIARLSRAGWLSLCAAGYINLFRSVPLVMVILWFYLIMPQVLAALFGQGTGDIRLTSAMVAFSMFEAAYYAEIIRAGIQSVPRGQTSAALALGLTKAQTLRYVVLPQGLRNMLPVLLTQGIILFQDTSLVYVIGLADFFGMAYKVGMRDGRLVELLLFAGGCYFILSLAASLAVRHLSKGRGR